MPGSFPLGGHPRSSDCAEALANSFRSFGLHTLVFEGTLFGVVFSSSAMPPHFRRYVPRADANHSNPWVKHTVFKPKEKMKTSLFLKNLVAPPGGYSTPTGLTPLDEKFGVYPFRTNERGTGTRESKNTAGVDPFRSNRRGTGTPGSRPRGDQGTRGIPSRWQGAGA